MNVWKAVTFAAIVASTSTVAYRVAQAQGACANQPNMANALSALRTARGFLERAEHNKGGWRVRAIESADAAIRETERGCAFADTH